MQVKAAVPPPHSVSISGSRPGRPAALPSAAVAGERGDWNILASPSLLVEQSAAGATRNGRAQRDLASKAQQGDHAAYAQLVREHQDRIFRHLLNLTGSREEALELSQEVFLKAWEALPGWRPEAQFHTWLYRIASNVAFDLLRRRQIVSYEPLAEDYDAPADAVGPEVRLQAKQSMTSLDAALARLPADQRQIVLLREVEGLSYQELATALAIEPGTVKSKLARARAALAEAYNRSQA